MLINLSLFLLLSPSCENAQERENGNEERRTRGESPLEREKDKGVGLGSAEAADGRQKNGGPYLKSTIEIQDPYAKSAAGGRGKRSWKIENEERIKERLYIEQSNLARCSLSLLSSR